jgi:hypothetical protein
MYSVYIGLAVFWQNLFDASTFSAVYETSDKVKTHSYNLSLSLRFLCHNQDQFYWTYRFVWRRLQVCPGPGLDLGSRPDTTHGLGLVAQIMLRSESGSGLVQMPAIKCYIEYFRLSRATFFSQRKTHSCSHLTLVTQSVSGHKSHRLYFVGYFRSCLFSAVVRERYLQTWHSTALNPSSNAKITSDVLWVSLSSVLKDNWHSCIKIKMYWRYDSQDRL